MNTTVGHISNRNRSQKEFLKRLLGDSLQILNSSSQTICRGIKANAFEVAYSTIVSEPEDRAYFNFYPVEDNKYHVLLSFFPEYDHKANDNSYQVIQLAFQPDFFDAWPQELMAAAQPFRSDRSASHTFNLPSCIKEPVGIIIDYSQSMKGFPQALQAKEAAIFLLRLCLEAFAKPDESSRIPACSFLNNNTERAKILEARTVILNRLDNPITIRELSRTIGMNECYLKKGFKAMFGKTVHEFQQFERIEKAKQLLKQNKYSINEVAFMMGFGSHSHFSTSFKKIAGMNPCELLG